MKSPPLFCRWDGLSFMPTNAHQSRLADKYFVAGAVYPLAVHEDRSTATHNHEFAWLNEAWQNLPETVADLYPTPEHLRKRALIQAGYYDEEIIDVGNKTGALRVAQSFRGKDDFAYVIVRGPVVIIRTAKSQSRRAMNKREFAASKAAIMEVIASMIGVPIDALQKEQAA